MVFEGDLGQSGKMASVDQTEARSVTGLGPDNCAARRNRNRATGSSEVRPGIGSTRGRRYGSATSSARRQQTG
jgi:hypothetical protein